MQILEMFNTFLEYIKDDVAADNAHIVAALLTIAEVMDSASNHIDE